MTSVATPRLNPLARTPDVVVLKVLELEDSLAYKPPASMSSSARRLRQSPAGRTAHFFELGEKCENPLEFLHLHRHANEQMSKLLNPVLGENLEDLHCELECQRSAGTPALLNSVLWKNLEDLHRPLDDDAELECQ